MNVSVSWTLSGGDSADFYLINITTNAPQTPYGGLLNLTTASVTQYELTDFMADYEHIITVRSMTANCGGLVGRESEPLTITPQGIYDLNCDGSEHCLQSNIEVVVWLAKLDHGTPIKYVANCVFTVYYTMSVIEPPLPSPPPPFGRNCAGKFPIQLVVYLV